MALTLTRMVWRFADAEWAAGLRPGQLHGRIARGVIRLTPDDVAGNGTGTSSWLTYPDDHAAGVVRAALRARGLARTPPAPPRASSRDEGERRARGGDAVPERGAPS